MTCNVFGGMLNLAQSISYWLLSPSSQSLAVLNVLLVMNLSNVEGVTVLLFCDNFSFFYRVAKK